MQAYPMPTARPRGLPMNEDERSGKWKQVKGRLRARWGRLTDDDLDQARGNTEHLLGKVQEYYGTSREDAKRQLDRIAKGPDQPDPSRSGNPGPADRA